MRALLVGCLAVGLIGLSQAQEKRTGTPAEQIKAIEKEFDTTLKNAQDELNKAAPGTQQAIITKAREKFGQLVKEATAISEANANDPAGIRALAFIAARGGMGGTPDAAKAAGTAAQTIKEKHLDKAGIGKLWAPVDAVFMEAMDELIVIDAPGWKESSGVAREIDFFKARNRRVSLWSEAESDFPA